MVVCEPDRQKERVASSISQEVFNPRHAKRDAGSLPVINSGSYLAFIGVILGVVKESHFCQRQHINTYADCIDSSH